MLIKTKHKPDMVWHAYSQHSVAEVVGLSSIQLHTLVNPSTEFWSFCSSLYTTLCSLPQDLSLGPSLLGLIDPLVASLPS